MPAEYSSPRDMAQRLAHVDRLEWKESRGVLTPSPVHENLPAVRSTVLPAVESFRNQLLLSLKVEESLAGLVEEAGEHQDCLLEPVK